MVDWARLIGHIGALPLLPPFPQERPMGRAPRVDAAGHLYHVLNRANRRMTIFEKPADYEAFERILTEAVDRSDVQLFSYCVMVK